MKNLDGSLAEEGRSPDKASKLPSEDESDTRLEEEQQPIKEGCRQLGFLPTSARGAVAKRDSVTAPGGRIFYNSSSPRLLPIF